MPVTINGTTGISGIDGTAASPAIEGSDTNTGMFFPAVDTVAITTDGTERMRVDSVGNVGIGTSSPNANLTVQGDANITFSPNVFNIRTRGTASATSGNSGSGISFQGYTTGTSSFADIAFISGIKENATDTNYAGALVFGTRTNGSGSGSFERLRIASNGALSSVVPGGSTLYPSFTARAWVNFNGTGTVAIRASGNVTSITDNNVGDYTVNLTTAMPDANYAITMSATMLSGSSATQNFYSNSVMSGGARSAPTISSFRVGSAQSGSGGTDTEYMQVAIFR